MNARTRGGFTLIEVLLALALGALVLGAVAATVDAAATLESRAAQRAREDRVAQMILARLTRELTSVVRAGDTTALRVIDGGRRDELSVWTLAYGAPRLVTYRWTIDRLERVDRDPTLDAEPEPVDLPGVTALDVHLNTATSRRDRWDEPGLPLSTAVELTVADRIYGTIIAH